MTISVHDVYIVWVWYLVGIYSIHVSPHFILFSEFLFTKPPKKLKSSKPKNVISCKIYFSLKIDKTIFHFLHILFFKTCPKL